ncbi:MAG: DHH family phosphoesterase [bacterium]|nr:DHH family phosphoesterase [bacterium]
MINNTQINDRLAQLDQILSDRKKMLIVVHNYPDPDAIAAAWALSYLAEKRNKVQSSIAHGGFIGRAENKVMLSELKINLKNISRIKFNSYDCIAVVDTQPQAGNNSLPLEVRCDLVINHHPLRKKNLCGFQIIEPEVGASATILTEILIASEVDIPKDLATALAYAIRSETQDLGRETSERDIQAYHHVYSRSNMPKLARITKPKLPRSYFNMLANTLHCTVSFRNIICAHLGKVEVVEMVAEMADLLLRHKHISWSLCTGHFNEELFLSLRSSNPQAKAGKLIQRIILDRKNAGGHGMFAGGKISIAGMEQEEIIQLEKRLSDELAKQLGFKNVNWNPLIEK